MSSVIERLSDIHLQEVHGSDQSIGKILLDAGKLRPGDAERALKVAKEQRIRFGAACMQLGLVTQADIDSALSRQFQYPYIRPGEADLSAELVAAYFPFSDQVEALRALRTQLLLRWFGPERRVLSIISSSRADGRSYLAANLAVVFSQLGESTLLIDADLRASRQHELFNVSNQYGMAALLTGRMEGSAIERVSCFANLSVLPAGATPPNPLELVSRSGFAAMIAEESRNYDVVLIDTPAAQWGSDAQAIAARAGGALVVTREDHSRVSDVSYLVESVQATATEVVGCVLNRF